MSVFYKTICLASQFGSMHTTSYDDEVNDSLEALAAFYNAVRVL